MCKYIIYNQHRIQVAGWRIIRAQVTFAIQVKLVSKQMRLLQIKDVEFKLHVNHKENIIESANSQRKKAEYR